MSLFGEKFKELRLKRGLSLRGFCKAFNLDPSNISKIERGVLVPSKEDIVSKYAICLGLNPNTQDFDEFVDMGLIDSGRIPDAIKRDEEIKEKLPVFFRCLKEKENPAETLDRLMKLLEGEV